LAFKFARHEYGLRCNKHEAELYSRNRNKQHRRLMLCPVFWCSPSGKLLIMRCAATPVTQAQANERKANASSEWDYEDPGDDGHPFEWKVSDLGGAARQGGGGGLRDNRLIRAMSGIHLIVDMCIATTDVRYGPKADMSAPVYLK
jgi:hypothetical protein